MTTHFPTPQSGDPDELVWALEKAGSLWTQNEAREAIRWLRRAANAASELGLRDRAMELAQVAGGLSKSHSLNPPVLPQALAPNPAAAEEEVSLSETIASPSAGRRATDLVRQAQQADLTRTAVSPGATRGAPIGQPRLDRTQNSPRPRSMTPAPATTPTTPIPGWEAAGGTHQPLSPAQLSTRAIIDVGQTGQGQKAAPSEAVSAPATSNLDSTQREGGQVPLAVRVAFRVAVKSRPSGETTVRPLKEGEEPEEGASAALLVGLDPSVDLFPGES